MVSSKELKRHIFFSKQWGRSGVAVGSQWGRSGVAVGSQWGRSGVAVGSAVARSGSQWVIARYARYTIVFETYPAPVLGAA